MLAAPLIANMGGIYQFIQTILSLFQGPMLALLILGAFTERATATGGLVTLISGVVLAAIIMSFGVNMLYVAFITFITSLITLWVVSMFTQAHDAEHLENLVYRPWRRS